MGVINCGRRVYANPKVRMATITEVTGLRVRANSAPTVYDSQSFPTHTVKQLAI